MKGIEGIYITFHPEYSVEDDDPLQGIRFVASPSLGPSYVPLTFGAVLMSSGTIDASLRDLVERILPLGTYYTAISSFIEHRSHLDYGLVNHALCAAIRDMLKVRLGGSCSSQPIYVFLRITKRCSPNWNTLSTHHLNSRYKNSGFMCIQQYIPFP